jgi:tetratricopeptide (TPR) repeat protein
LTRKLLALTTMTLALGAPFLLAHAQDEDDKPAKPAPEKKDPNALPEDPLERARALMNQGRHDEAVELARSLAEKDPKALAPRSLLVSLFLKTGRDAEADKASQALLALDRTEPRSHVLRGRYLELTGDLDAADAEYELAVGIAKDLEGFEPKVRLAALRAERGKKKEARSLLTKVLDDYQSREDLTPNEFVWVARGCRLLDFDPEVKAEYAQKMTAYARQMLDQALDKDLRYVPALIEYGKLYLDKGDVPAAQEAFERAVKVDPNDPEARVGLARALVEASYRGSARYGDAEDQLKKALAADPTNANAHALLAQLAVTDGDPDRALERCQRALVARPWDVSLLAAKGAALVMKGDTAGFQALEKAVLEKFPTCARFYDEAARVVCAKFRYAEARDLARKALALDPGYHPARATLGINLLRTGDEANGKKELAAAFKEDPYDVITFNTLGLLDRLDKDYQTVETDKFVLRLHKKEMKGSSKFVLGLLEEARAKLTKKYGVELKQKTLVELFPRVEDFSARSIGLPFIPALGVCFGDVVTVVSANEKKTFGKHSWGRTLWHEFTHVVTLNKTHNRIPRWLTEGLSVYEESRGRKSWVREYDVPILTLRHRGLILPLATFDEGFTKPRFPNQVMMSYYQGGLTCEFIEQRYGFKKILELLDQYATGKTTKDAVPAAFGLTLEQFDAQFKDFLEVRYAGLAYMPPPTDEEKNALLDRVTEAPWDVAARGALARAYALLGKPGDAEAHAGQTLQGARSLELSLGFLGFGEPEAGLPGSGERASARAVWLRAGAGDACLALGIVAQERSRIAEALRYFHQALALGTRDPVEARKRRAQIFRTEKRWDEAIREYETIERIVPPMADIHRVLSACHGAKGDKAGALAELDIACSLDSDDLKTRLEVAGEYRKEERWADVARVLDDAAYIDPFVPEAHFLLAEGLRHEEKWTRALATYEAAEDAGMQSSADLEAGTAECLLALGRKAEAAARAEKALAIDPDNAVAKKVKDEAEKK